MNQLKKRPVERALAGELNGHLKREAAAPNSLLAIDMSASQYLQLVRV